MLKHVLDQMAPLLRRNKCQHDEGEDSNAVLSLLHWDAGVMNVQQRQTHFYLSPPVCGGGRVNVFSQGLAYGGQGMGQAI